MATRKWVFCGMTGAGTPDKLDPRVRGDLATAQQFYQDRIGPLVEAGATDFIIHMPQGYADGNDYTAALFSVLNSNQLTILPLLNTWYPTVRFHFYVGRIGIFLDPATLNVGNIGDGDNEPDWTGQSGEDWELWAQTEWSYVARSDRKMFIDAASDLSSTQLNALRQIITAQLGFEGMAIEPWNSTIDSTDDTTLSVLALARNPNFSFTQEVSGENMIVVFDSASDNSAAEGAQYSGTMGDSEANHWTDLGFVFAPSWGLSASRARELWAYSQVNDSGGGPSSGAVLSIGGRLYDKAKFDQMRRISEN